MSFPERYEQQNLQKLEPKGRFLGYRWTMVMLMSSTSSVCGRCWDFLAFLGLAGPELAHFILTERHEKSVVILK